MKTLSVLLLALLPALPAAAAQPIPEVVPLASIPPVSLDEPAAASDLMAFLMLPIDAERGLKVFGLAAVIVVAVGRLRFRAEDGAGR